MGLLCRVWILEAQILSGVQKAQLREDVWEEAGVPVCCFLFSLWVRGDVRSPLTVTPFFFFF